MKKVLIAGVVASMVLPFFAQAIDNEDLPKYPGGHQRIEMAGWSDSINNKGAWLMTRVAGNSQISYIAEHPELQAEWQSVISAFYK